MTQLRPDFDDKAPIVSGTLVLRPVTVGNAEAITSIDRDQTVQRGFAQKAPPALEDTRTMISKIEAERRQGMGNRFMFVIALGEDVIGHCEMDLRLDIETRLIGEPAIAIEEKSRRHGHALSALRTLTAWSFARLPFLTEIWGICVNDNEASVALMASLGMTDDGPVISNDGTPMRKYHLSRPKDNAPPED